MPHHLPTSHDEFAEGKGIQPNGKHWKVPWGLAWLSHRDPELDEYIYDDVPWEEQTYAYVVDSGVRTSHQVYMTHPVL